MVSHVKNDFNNKILAGQFNKARSVPLGVIFKSESVMIANLSSEKNARNVTELLNY